jgi:hypothetical protein
MLSHSTMQQSRRTGLGQAQGTQAQGIQGTGQGQAQAPQFCFGLPKAPYGMAASTQPPPFAPSVFQGSAPQQRIEPLIAFPPSVIQSPGHGLAPKPQTVPSQAFATSIFQPHGQTAPVQSQTFTPSVFQPHGQTAPAPLQALTTACCQPIIAPSQSTAQGFRGPCRPALPPKLAAALSPVLSLNCREGHGLVCISGKPAQYIDWICDLCKQRIPHDTKYVMHCDKCSVEGHVACGGADGFDICPTCRGKARDAMSIWPLIINAAGCPMFPGVGEYWQTLYCHRQQAPYNAVSSGCWNSTTRPCGPRQGDQCSDCKRGQDALIASEGGTLLNRSGRAMKHVCYGAKAGMYFCNQCTVSQVPCDSCKFTQENLPDKP